MQLNNKNTFITGGTSGMGLATAKRFLKEGATVTVTARRETTIDSTENELAAPDRSQVILADVKDKSATATALASSVDRFGKIDVLFLNAGIGKPRPIEAVDDAVYDNQWDTNFKGVLFTIQSALPHLNDGASIILNTSISNVKGMPGMSVYAATKAGLRSLARTLAAELAPRKIRVNAMSPGPIETPIWGKMDLPAEAAAGFAEQVKAQIPLGRMGTSEEIASAVLFLASDESSFVNGIELPVDGGMAQV